MSDAGRLLAVGDRLTPTTWDELSDEAWEQMIAECEEENRFAFDESWGLRLMAEFFGGECHFCCDGRECGCGGTCIAIGHWNASWDHVAVADVDQVWRELTL
jgi:hypothetical protein